VDPNATLSAEDASKSADEEEVMELVAESAGVTPSKTQPVSTWSTLQNQWRNIFAGKPSSVVYFPVHAAVESMQPVIVVSKFVQIFFIWR
jgi:hypothetical protein